MRILPQLVAGWDVCLMPFALNESTEFISPTKTLEYMAAGKPVVSTPIHDVKAMFGDLVAIAATPDAFIAGLPRRDRRIASRGGCTPGSDAVARLPVFLGRGRGDDPRRSRRRAGESRAPARRGRTPDRGRGRSRSRTRSSPAPGRLGRLTVAVPRKKSDRAERDSRRSPRDRKIA